MNTEEKIGILADAAKYDASCSTSGSARENTRDGLGNAALGGICHAWSSDGRCVSLLKVLLSNICAYDCAYCVNRRSNDIRRAAFEEEELVRLIMDFYRRNYIEGAFLSSAVTGCPDGTMERLVHIARTLRTKERFNGYIHLKIIPGASEELVLEAARWADRASVNIELPSSASLAHIAPDKTPKAIFGPMKIMAQASGFTPRLPQHSKGTPTASIVAENRLSLPLNGASWPQEDAGRQPEPRTVSASAPATTPASLPAPHTSTASWPISPQANTSPASREGAGSTPDRPRPDYGDDRTSVMEARQNRRRDPEASLIPAGQTTQLVIGASPESDATILSLAENLYLAFDVRRVYYSAFIPTGADPRLPAVGKPPLAREHRLYQADWLFRFYGFQADEILDAAKPFLDLDLDPKSGWALRNMAMFPVEVNSAPYHDLLRVPGIGPVSAKRIVGARASGTLRAESLSALGVVMRRACWFITVAGKLVATESTDAESHGMTRHFLENPVLLRSALVDPSFKKSPSAQLEFQWGEDTI